MLTCHVIPTSVSSRSETFWMVLRTYSSVSDVIPAAPSSSNMNERTNERASERANERERTCAARAVAHSWRDS